MEVYRITLARWAGVLTPSGFPARWNSKGIYMLYTSSSRALAGLENVVHRSGLGLQQLFKTTVIEIPKAVKVMSVPMSKLPKQWFTFENYTVCQEIGDQWLMEQKSAVLKVPSAIVKQEHNFLINPAHPDFHKIKVTGIEDFEFDPRIKE